MKTKRESLIHGINCRKVPHDNGTGYAHAPQDNTIYVLNGKEYCGRCHIDLATSDRLFQQPQEALKVRIAVAVELDTGDWNSYGKRFAGEQLPDSEKIDAAIHPLEGRLQVYWVEAVIPITDPPVIVGTVKEGEKTEEAEKRVNIGLKP